MYRLFAAARHFRGIFQCSPKKCPPLNCLRVSDPWAANCRRAGESDADPRRSLHPSESASHRSSKISINELIRYGFIARLSLEIPRPISPTVFDGAPRRAKNPPIDKERLQLTRTLAYLPGRIFPYSTSSIGAARQCNV